MKTQYTNLLDLLRDDGLTFRERMAGLDKGMVDGILGLKPKLRPDREFAEHYFTMVGKRDGDVVIASLIDCQTQGNPGLVEFDWEQVWKRHLEHRDVLGWFHTHPPKAHGMSATDRNTFQGWLTALGGPRYAVIQCEGLTHCWRLQLDGSKLVYKPLDADILEDGRISIQDPL